MTGNKSPPSENPQTSNVVHRTEGEKLKRTCEEKLN